MAVDKDKSPETPGFKNAADYTPDEHMVMQTNFQNFFQWVLDMAKGNAPENNGISVKAAIGIFSAEITYASPIVRYSRGGQPSQPTKKATLQTIQDLLSADQGSIEITETDTEIRIRPTSFMGDRWKPIMQGLNVYVGAKWNKIEGKDKSYWSVTK
ncbi:hypothetical protein ES707_10085 [subsurface metagenome]